MIQNLDVILWNRKVGSLVTYKERYTEKICFYFDRDFLGSGYVIAPLQASIHSVSDYERYAQQAGVNGYWTQKIKEETGYRIENMSDTIRQKGLGR